MSEGERKYTGFAAIYQLEQEKLKREKTQAEITSPGEEPQGAPESTAPEEEDSHAESDRDDRSHDPSEASSLMGRATESSSLKAPTSGALRRSTGRKTGRGTRPRPAVVKSAAPPAEGSVEYYAQKWKQAYRLNKGEINVMRVMFRLTHETGVSECYIKVPEVAEAARLKKRRCQYVIRSLEEMGFLDRLEEYDPSNRLGTKYRVNLKPRNLDLG